MATKLHKRKRSDQEVLQKKAKLNLNPGEQNNTDLDKLNEGINNCKKIFDLK